MRADTQHRKQIAVPVPSQLSADAIERFYADLQQALEKGADTICFDCSGVHSVQSNHIAVLWSAREMCETAGARAVLENPTFGLRRVIRLLDLQDMFEIEGSVYQADDDIASDEQIESALVFVDRFEPNPMGVDRSLQAFLEYLERMGVPEAARFDLQTIFYEIATNISQHAHLGQGEMVSFRVEPRAGSVELVFEDNGLPFDPTTHLREVNVREAAQAGRTRGFGLPLIGKLTDGMSYERIDDRTNRLRIARKWRIEE